MDTGILVVDGQHVVREGTVRLLEGSTRAGAVRGVASGEEALAMLREGGVGLLVVDHHLGGVLQGIDLIAEARRVAPALPVLVLSNDHRRPMVEAAVSAGALAYVSKRSPVQELTAGIEAVLCGRHFLAQAIADGESDAAGNKAGTALTRLSRREREVLLLIARGARSREVAEALGISPKTVEKHRAKLSKKLAARNIADLTRFALESGLLG